jgi:hypothetical protein
VDSAEHRLLKECKALERQVGLLSLQGIQTATIHTAMFMQLLAAKEARSDRLAKFYAERFPTDVRKLTTDGWRRSLSSDNSNADPHPFVPNLYEVRGTREAADASTKAAGVLEESRSAGNVSGQYLSNTVLFAMVLFFASASGKFEQWHVRVVAFGFAAAVFAFTVPRTAMLPQ